MLIDECDDEGYDDGDDEWWLMMTRMMIDGRWWWENPYPDEVILDRYFYHVMRGCISCLITNHLFESLIILLIFQVSSLKQEIEKKRNENIAFLEESTRSKSENSKLAEELEQKKDTESLLREKCKIRDWFNSEVCCVNIGHAFKLLSLSLLNHYFINFFKINTNQCALRNFQMFVFKSSGRDNCCVFVKVTTITANRKDWKQVVKDVMAETADHV